MLGRRGSGEGQKERENLKLTPREPRARDGARSHDLEIMT